MYQFFPSSSSSSYALGPLGLRKEGRVCVCVTETALLNLFTLEQLSLSLSASFLLSLSLLLVSIFSFSKRKKKEQEKELEGLELSILLFSFLFSCLSSFLYSFCSHSLPSFFRVLQTDNTLESVFSFQKVTSFFFPSHSPRTRIELCLNQESNQSINFKNQINQKKRRQSFFFVRESRIDFQGKNDS